MAAANAILRMRERTRPPGARIVDDPFAARFKENDWRLLSLRALRWVFPPLWLHTDALQTAHCVRHRVIDELLVNAVARDGFEQIVVVGAGYDMRWARLGLLADPVRWFEIDRAPTSEAKRRALPDPVPAGWIQAHADLEVETLGEVLARTPFDPRRSTCFVAEGLVHYLTPLRFDSLLSEMASGPGRRRVLLSFIRTETYESASGLLIQMMKALREIPHLHFRTGHLAELCARHGFTGFKSWRFEEQVEAFAPTARGRRIAESQDVAQLDRLGGPAGD